MSIAINEEHRGLADTVSDFLTKHDALGANRALLEADVETVPPFWGDFAALGWLGLHVPEANGGSGYGLEELAIVVEELGRVVAPGPFVPTTIAAGILADSGTDDLRNTHLAGLADGSKIGTVALHGDLALSGSSLSGSAVALSATLADLLLVVVGDDVCVAEAGAPGLTIQTPPSMDPARRSSRLHFDDVAVTVIPGAGGHARAIARTVLAAEATGVARQCTTMAARYAKERVQFGRVIAMFQAVKHHCANMAVAAELATSAVWDASRASATGGDQFSYAAACAATLAGPAADLCANLNTQVHGGIAITFEHDAHLYMRRATSLLTLLDPDRASCDLTGLLRSGVSRSKAVELPPEAEPIRAEVRTFAASIAELGRKERRAQLIETGYVMPHWPEPYGRAAGAIEQLVIEEEFAAAGIERPSYGITGWVILTLIQHGTDDQVARWVRPALDREVIWCQLFSEPDAGSDAAGVKTRATRVEGGWTVTGQKVWTSGAHVAARGFATVRTDPDAPKHQGVTMMVIDMQADGVEVRPIKMPSGDSEFNEVFFDDVFVPDDDVVGPVDGGWTVARATLGNESVSIGGGQGAMSTPAETLIPLFDAAPSRLYGGAGRIGQYAARLQAMGLLNLRSAHRAISGGEPGPEGAMTKLVLSEIGHEAAAILTELGGTDALFLDGSGATSNTLVLTHRGLSIAGGTSEIKRNQIGERILGLPRDPLLK